MNRFQNYYQNKKHKRPTYTNSTNLHYYISGNLPPTESQKKYLNDLREFLISKGMSYIEKHTMPSTKKECTGRISSYRRLLYENDWTKEFYDREGSAEDVKE